MTTTTKIRVSIDTDSMIENPTEYDGWKVYSFNRRHVNFTHPTDCGFKWDKATSRYVPTVALQRKLKVGRAFILSYYEHGPCRWDISGTYQYPDSEWDSSSFAGVLVWEQPAADLGPRSYENRKKDATGLLKIYTDWCNGWGLKYTIEKVTFDGEEEIDSEDLDSCCGFYHSDLEHMKQTISQNLDTWGFRFQTSDIEVTGDAGVHTILDCGKTILHEE